EHRDARRAGSRARRTRLGNLPVVFTSDATGYARTGVEHVIAQVRAHLDGRGPTQHLLGNHRVSVDGDRARSRTSARVYDQGAGVARDNFSSAWAATRITGYAPRPGGF